jgi:hypothetical protein
MTGYLEGYGAGEERRERIIKRSLVAALVVLVVGGALYFFLRDYREKQQIQAFLELLQKKDYRAAYQMWGCTEASPCREYSFEKFLEDWGPKSPHANLSSVKVVKTRSCSSGVIQTLNFGDDDEVWLWVGRKDLTLGFAPWPMCNPQMPASGPPAS